MIVIVVVIIIDYRYSKGWLFPVAIVLIIICTCLASM